MLAGLGQARAAESEIGRALQLKPQDGEVQRHAGYLFLQESRFADARQHYEAATKLLPSDPSVLAELAATDYRMNDRDAAAAAFAKSVGLDSNYVVSRPDLVQMWRDVAAAKGR